MRINYHNICARECDDRHDVSPCSKGRRRKKTAGHFWSLCCLCVLWSALLIKSLYQVPHRPHTAEPSAVASLPLRHFSACTRAPLKLPARTQHTRTKQKDFERNTKETYRMHSCKTGLSIQTVAWNTLRTFRNASPKRMKSPSDALLATCGANEK